MTKEIYISTDIEADGPIPGEYSMLSFGSVAIDKNGKILGEFYRKLKPLPKAKRHPETMRFWKQNSAAWKEAISNPEDPEKVMNEYFKWCWQFRSDKNNQRPVFIAWPATFDFMWVYWYLIKFVKNSKKEFLKFTPFGISGLDVRTYASAILKKNYLDTNALPAKWTKNTGKHNHKSIEDARKNALIFINMLKENQK